MTEHTNAEIIPLQNARLERAFFVAAVCKIFVLFEKRQVQKNLF